MKKNAYIAVMNGGKLTIGDSVSIARNSILVCHDNISIGSCCAIAPNVLIYDHDHKFGMEGIVAGFNTTPVVIERNCWIGAGAIILRGTHIGEGSVIGAGCLVKGNVPPHSPAGDRCGGIEYGNDPPACCSGSGRSAQYFRNHRLFCNVSG